MKKFFSIFFFGLSAVSLFAQVKPTNYSFGGNRLAKTLDQTPASNTIEKILIQDNVIWLATGNGLSKSTDNGSTWTNYYNSKDFGTESVSAVAYSNGTIWAATWHNETKFDGDHAVGTGLKFSSDQGQTWNSITQPMDQKTDTVITYGINKLKAVPVATNVDNFVYDIAFTKNTIWAACYKGGGLRKSIDGGKSWSRVVLPPDNLNSIKPSDILNFSMSQSQFYTLRLYSLLAVDDTTIYVGTAGGIIKSTDNGSSWIKFNHTNQSNPISGNFVLSIKQNHFDKSIWAATWKADGQTEFYGVSVSYDGGQSWKNFLADEHTLDFGFKYFGAEGNYSGADVIAAADDGAFRSHDNGNLWIAAPNIIDDFTKVEINTKNFRSVKTNRKIDGSTDIWLGTLNGLAKLNETNGFWTGSWKVFLASEKLTSTSETYAFPNPFSPSQDIVKIKYSTDQPISVTIRILDFGMHLVRTLIQNAQRNSVGDHFENWDGKDENGITVPNGVYFYRIDIGSNKPLFGKIMVLM